LVKINLKFLLRKTGASLNFMTELRSLHISPGDKVKFVRLDKFKADVVLVPS
jgi:hypothetical protein